jgi:hypothetical protein
MKPLPSRPRVEPASGVKFHLLGEEMAIPRYLERSAAGWPSHGFIRGPPSCREQPLVLSNTVRS